MPSKRCLGCNQLFPLGVFTKGRCPDCYRQWKSHYDRRYRQRRGGYGGQAWTKISRAYRKAHPICELCGRAPSQDVHHIDHAPPSAVRGRDPSNLIAVCKSCHAQEHARRLTGGRAPPSGTVHGNRMSGT